MIWNIATRSKMVMTRFGELAVRVDGGADMAPLLLSQRFRGTMEDWDTRFISRLAVGRQVIRFESAGIGESEGETPNTVAAMAEIVPALLDALKLDRTDLLGWSLGGYVAQTVALNWPQRVRRLVIAGSGPGGPDGPPPHPRVAGNQVLRVSGRHNLIVLWLQFLASASTKCAGLRSSSAGAEVLESRGPLIDPCHHGCSRL
jgi:pimeloyl-ACP methyl ester carboxylesterase